MEKQTQRAVLVFVTDQPDCKRLIEAGDRLAREYGVPLRVLSIRPTAPMTEYSASRLQVLYDLSGKLGAEMTVIFHDDVILTAAVYAKKLGAVHIVSGSPGAHSALFIEGVRQCIPEIPWSVVDASDRLITFPPMKSEKAE